MALMPFQSEPEATEARMTVRDPPDDNLGGAEAGRGHSGRC